LFDQTSLPSEFLDWQLASSFGWTYDQIQDSPGPWCDWMLAIQRAHVEFSKEHANDE
jgi:hypothetical protein